MVVFPSSSRSSAPLGVGGFGVLSSGQIVVDSRHVRELLERADEGAHGARSSRRRRAVWHAASRGRARSGPCASWVEQCCWRCGSATQVQNRCPPRARRVVGQRVEQVVELGERPGQAVRRLGQAASAAWRRWRSGVCTCCVNGRIWSRIGQRSRRTASCADSLAGSERLRGGDQRLRGRPEVVARGRRRSRAPSASPASVGGSSSSDSRRSPPGWRTSRGPRSGVVTNSASRTSLRASVSLSS